MSLYDSVTAANEPDGPGNLGAGYGDGWYNNWAQVVARFGTRAVLEVCVNPADQVGNCLDVETGDANPADAPGWTARARTRGIPVVWNYCNASTWPAVIAAYLDAGARLPDRWWIADYTGSPHFPAVTVRSVTYTADACQYAGGMTAAYDVSCVQPAVFGAAPTPTAMPTATHPASNGAPMPPTFVAILPTPTNKGYWEIGSDGGVFSHGDATFHGSLGGVTLAKPIVAADRTPTGSGYWLAGADGGVFCFGDAQMHGSLGTAKLNAPIVGIRATSTGGGYWLLGADGGVFAFGDAAFEGSGT